MNRYLRKLLEEALLEKTAEDLEWALLMKLAEEQKKKSIKDMLKALGAKIKGGASKVWGSIKGMPTWAKILSGAGAGGGAALLVYLLAKKKKKQ